MSSTKAAVVRSFGKFSASSLTASAVDLWAFSALCEALGPCLGEKPAILAATVLARVLSSLGNYLLNYFLVFHSRTAHSRSAGLYTLITVLKTLASALLVAGLAGLLPDGAPTVTIKIPVDMALFFVNYLAQKNFVYQSKTK